MFRVAEHIQNIRGVLMSRNIRYITFFVLGALPLFIYPFVLLANIMSLAGSWSGQEESILIAIVLLFIILTSSYPITYIICLVLYLIKKFKNKAKNGAVLVTKLPLLPLIHLVLAILVGCLWWFLG
ncbi:hypothetical protein PATY110618_28310 [Paenibacillus typhae]|uniref:Uncharacterized protein n=1 Tax=Paenibacillus typhae TaxID=1174501 RepID=A0A1G9GVV2_9BACL|nr:hypothetical protein SAMN05216192_1695 [Paenibacillus typhae]